MKNMWINENMPNYVTFLLLLTKCITGYPQNAHNS